MRLPALLLLSILRVFAADTPDANQLTWFQGCWSTTQGPLHIEEHWSKPSGGHLIGFSRTTKGGRAAFWEFLTIQTNKDGEITYNPRLSNNQPPVAFKLIKQTETEVVFENAAHDFPQRIIYTKSASGDLQARIEGTVNGKLRVENFPYQKAACQ